MEFFNQAGSQFLREVHVDERNLGLLSRHQTPRFLCGRGQSNYTHSHLLQGRFYGLGHVPAVLDDEDWHAAQACDV
jgi:hypothetical protein